jgi:hypothetical protein
MKTLFSILILTITLSMTSQNHVQPTVDVTGKGTVTIVPDEATINVRVENTGTDASAVKQQNDATINNVFAFLKKMKLDDKYIKSEYVNLSKNYEYNTKTYKYNANQSISIQLKDLSRYEEIMNGLLQTGINRIDGVSFSSSKQNELESVARKKAVENAKMKATEYAGVLDQTIGAAVRISEFQMSNNAPQPMYKMMAMDGASNESQQTIAPGEMEIVVTVNVSFVLN